MNYFIACIFFILSLNAPAATDLSNVIDTSKLANPFDGQNNLYNRIFTELNSQYQAIGQRQALNILQNNSVAVTGGLNSVGLTYSQPFGDFSILLNRNLAPDLTNDTRWIVTDTFTIHIDASKVMNNLQNQNAINLDQKTLAAFVGVAFQRTFTWVHFANSYEEGLSTHFEKLFFPFHALTYENMSNLSNNEMIFKEDSISLSGGGFVSAPIYPGIGVMGGVLGKFQKMSRFEAIATDQNNLQLSLETSSLLSAGFSVSIEGLFLNVLKLTLLSYDFEYDHESSYKIYTNFKINELQAMSANNPVANQINLLIQTKQPDLAILAPYILSEEQHLSENITNSYNFLIFGGNKTSQTQEIEITSGGRIKTFFTHYYEKVKYTEDLLSTIFSGFISALTNSSPTTAKMASDTKKIEMEYDSDKNLLDAHQDIDLGIISNTMADTQKLSLNFSSEYMTKKSTGTLGSQYRDRAIYALGTFSGVDPLISQMLSRDYLQAPILVQGHYQINTDGIRNLNSLNTNQAFDSFSTLCDTHPKTIFFNLRSLFSNCKVSLQNDYLNYLKDLTHNQISGDLIANCEKASGKFFFFAAKKRNYIKNCLSNLSYKDSVNWTVVPLWTLKNLSQDIVNNSNNILDYANIFGAKNVFFYGSIDAVTSDGRTFTSTFHEGAFKGFGAVDHYMRQENLRSPASVIVGQ